MTKKYGQVQNQCSIEHTCPELVTKAATKTVRLWAMGRALKLDQTHMQGCHPEPNKRDIHSFKNTWNILTSLQRKRLITFQITDLKKHSMRK